MNCARIGYAKRRFGAQTVPEWGTYLITISHSEARHGITTGFVMCGKFRRVAA